ncbi:class I SAM-dependent methyltransferase [Myroides sp. LJL119]
MDSNYWEARYLDKTAFWDAKAITTPLKQYIDQLTDKTIRILIPGLGHGYELLYLYSQGFTNVTGLDLTNQGVLQTSELYEDFPLEKVEIGDFFAHVGEYDLILEQTFFCSLPVCKREAYVCKINDLLSDKGKLVGVLFDCEFNNEQPPFGGNKELYKSLFYPTLHIKTMQRAYNSIKPRADRELFIIIEKQQHG